LRLFLIAPEIRRCGLLFELLEFGAFGIYVKETSATQSRGVSNLHTAHAGLGWHSHQALIHLF